MNIWIFETEDGGAMCEIEHSREYVEYRTGYISVFSAEAAMAAQYPDVVPIVQRLAQPQLKLGNA